MAYQGPPTPPGVNTSFLSPADAKAIAAQEAAGSEPGYHPAEHDELIRAIEYARNPPKHQKWAQLLDYDELRTLFNSVCNSPRRQLLHLCAGEVVRERFEETCLSECYLVSALIAGIMKIFADRSAAASKEDARRRREGLPARPKTKQVEHPPSRKSGQEKQLILL